MSEHLSHDWHMCSLAELGDYVNGFAFKPDDWSESGLPIIRIAQITGSSNDCDYFTGRISDRFKITSGDIIFSWSGTLAVVKWSGGPAWLNQHLFRVDPAAGVDPEFLFHVLSESVAEMDKRAHGSTMKHIKRGELREHIIQVPHSVTEQKKIAKILDTLDTQIHQTEALIAKLEKIKQGLLTDLLTRGIADNGQLRPSPAQAPQLYKDSPLGPIPKEWEAVKIGDEAEIAHGFAFSGDLFSSQPIGPALLVPGNFHRNGGLYFEERNTKYYSGTYPKESMLRNGDLLIVMTDLSPMALILGKTVILNQPFSVLHNQRIGKFLIKRPTEWINSFISIAMNGGNVRAKIISEATGTTVKHTSPSRIAGCRIPKPKPAEQEMICEALCDIEDWGNTEIEHLKKLKTQKHGLMDDLLTGRVRVTPLLASATTENA